MGSDDCYIRCNIPIKGQCYLMFETFWEILLPSCTLVQKLPLKRKFRYELLTLFLLHIKFILLWKCLPTRKCSEVETFCISDSVELIVPKPTDTADHPPGPPPSCMAFNTSQLLLHPFIMRICSFIGAAISVYVWLDNRLNELLNFIYQLMLH